MEIFKLFGSIFIDDKGANKSLDDVDNKANKTGSTLGGMIGTAAKWGAGLAAGATAAGAGLFALASHVSDTASEINDMSARTGISAKNLQELKFVTGQVGVNFDSITNASGKLTKTMADAAGGSKTAQAAFKQLGVDTTDSTGHLRKMDDVFPEVIKKLAGMTNESERNALAMKVFGKGAVELVPLLAAGVDGIDGMTKQAHDLGLVMSDEAIVAGDNFGDTMDAMKGALGGVIAKVGVELMPIFQKMMDWIIAHMPEIQATIHAAFHAVGVVIGSTIDVIKSLTHFFTDHWATIQPILAGILAGAVTFGIYTLAINASAIATGIWSTVTGVATTVGAAFGAVLAFITSPIGLVVIAIGLLIAAGVLLYENWDKVSAFLRDTWNSIKEFAMNVFNAVKDFFVHHWQLILTIFTGPIGLLVSLIVDNWISIKNKTQEIWDAIKGFFVQVWEGIKFIFFNLTLPGILIKHWDSIASKIHQVWDAIKGFLGKMWDGISSTATTVFQGIANFLSGIWDGVKTAISTVWNGIADTISGVWDRIVGGIKSSINTIIGAINSFINGVNSIHISIPSVKIPLTDKVIGGGEISFPHIPNIPMLAKGGDITEGGRVMVGEAGPETLDLPKGARVTPLPKETPQTTTEVTNHYHFAPGSVVIPAKDLKEMRIVQDFFDRFPQAARAMGFSL